MNKPQETYGSVTATASVGSKDGQVYGIFYRGGVRHIAPYIKSHTAARQV